MEEIHHQVIELNEKRDLMGFMTLKRIPDSEKNGQEKRVLPKKGRLEIARNMKADGIPVELIMKYTQLTEEVRNL